MTPRFRYVAPAGAPIRAIDLLRWGIATMRHRTPDALPSQVRARFGVDHAFVTSTGRAGMTLLLKALRTVGAPERDEVIVPSYTCYSVAASVVKAGLRPRIVDVSPDTLDYDLDDMRRADFSRVLAVVVTNLYGLPGNLPAIVTLAHDRGAFVVDDAAQAMGASIDSQASGTWGDAGLFSLDKGKNVSAIDGGIVVTRSARVAAALHTVMDGLPSPSARESGAGALKALIYAAMLRPSLYWIPRRMPGLGLGKTVFTTEYPLERQPQVLTALAIGMLDRLEAFTRARVDNATTLLTQLRSVDGIRLITPAPGSVPVYLRLPLLMPNASARERALADLDAAGIGATASYPASLVDVPELRPALANPDARATGGRFVAERIVTLPTHPYVACEDLAATVAALAAAATVPDTLAVAVPH